MFPVPVTLHKSIDTLEEIPKCKNEIILKKHPNIIVLLNLSLFKD